MIPNKKRDHTPEGISSTSKDAKVWYLLHSGLDNVISNRVIGYKFTKEIRDALKVRCHLYKIKYGKGYLYLREIGTLLDHIGYKITILKS